jgi:phage tail sheath protein FI
MGKYASVFGGPAELELPIPKDRRQWWFHPDRELDGLSAIRESVAAWIDLGKDQEAVASGAWMDAWSAMADIPLATEIAKMMEGRGPLIPISAAVCGMLVGRDRTIGAWHSGAGQWVKGVKPHGHLFEGMNGLVRMGENAVLRSFLPLAPWRGGANGWLQLNRLGMSIEDNCTYYLNQFQGMPNVVGVWQQAANTLASVMNAFYHRGAFAKGTSPECWNLKIGIGDTLTEQEAASGLLRVRIGYAPLVPNQFETLEIEVQMQPWA